MRRMVNGDMGLSDAAYDCPSVALSSLEGGRYELKVVMERYALAQLSPSSRVMRVQTREMTALAGMISALPKTCRLDMVGLPVSGGIVVRDESPYHQVLFESEPITELDYERNGAGCASDGVPVRLADKGLFLDKAVFLSRRKCGLLVLSLSPVGSPKSVSPLCVLNFDIEEMTLPRVGRFAACGGGRPYVHAYFDRNRNLVVYCGKDGWEKTVTLAAEWLVGMCETVAQSYGQYGKEASDGVRAWFALGRPESGVVAAAVSTDEASAVCPGAVSDGMPGARPDECLFLENDGRDRWPPFCGTSGK